MAAQSPLAAVQALSDLVAFADAGPIGLSAILDAPGC
jgi:hypothetical protein